MRRRNVTSTGTDGSFEDLWSQICDTHIGGETSFAYILNRTMMRPREVLRFVKTAVDVALNRGHDRVTEEDLLYAERAYSEDALVDITLELKDLAPELTDVPYAFIGSRYPLTEAEVRGRLRDAHVEDDDHERVIEYLLWFGFSGLARAPDDGRYSYEFQYDLLKMKKVIGTAGGYSIHPAFRVALNA